MSVRPRLCAAALPRRAPRTRWCRTPGAIPLTLAALLSGCVLAPRGTDEERLRAAAAGAPYAPSPAERRADLVLDPDWRDVLRHAFLHNGDLEAAYRDWAAAVHRIDIAAGYPNTNVSLGFEYLFSGDNLKGWDRTSLSIGFDPMQNLSFPTKVLAAGRVAYDEARAAGARFAQAKLDLQSEVLDAWLEYALRAEQVRLQAEQVDLERLAVRTAAARVEGGDAQQDLLEAELALGRAEDRLAVLAADLDRRRARLNGLIGRPPDAPLAPPELPEARPLPATDAELLAAAGETSPEIAALAHDVAGREDALDLARQQYFPDVNPFAGITGGIEQVAGAAITFATMIPQIRAGIREAEESLAASEARLRQARGERAGELVAALLAFRDAERQRDLLEQRLLPLASAAADNAAQRSAVGETGLGDLIAAERMLIELRVAIAEARIARERELAEVERLAGLDVETLAADRRERAPTSARAADAAAPRSAS